MGKLIMVAFFSVTTPLGIVIGIGILSTYDESSTTALLVEGIFDSVSAGILVYMSLVSLIATDFLVSRRLRANSSLQLYSCTALFCGAASMSVLAYWA
jgi:zinc transporter 1/2/3